MSDEPRQLTDVTWTRFVITITQALSDRMLKWAAVVMAVATVGVILFRPVPFWAYMIAGGFVALLSPLWLRRHDRD